MRSALVLAALLSPCGGAVAAATGSPRSNAFAANEWPPDGRGLCTAPGSQYDPRIVSDGASGAIVVWYDARAGHYDVYAQRVLADGTPAPSWPADGRALCAAANDQTDAALVSDGVGGAIAVWQDARSGPLGDIYAQRIRADGTVDPAWPADGRAVCVAAGAQYAPAAVSDGAGGAIVTWQDERSGSADIYAQRILANGTVDPAWPADGRALCAAPGAQLDPTLVSDGAGGAIVAWMDLRSGTGYDIYAQRVIVQGIVAPGWPADGRLLCGASGSQLSPAAASDGAGGAIVTWTDGRTDSTNIYAQRVLANGAVDPAWPTNGSLLCGAGNDQAYPTIVSDGAGGALVAWHDYRSGLTTDIYAQRVLSSGVVDPDWPVDGRLVCGAASFQYYPALVGDGAGGAIVTWYDYRNGNADVFAQHVFSGGVVDGGWPAEGRPMCVAAGDQTFPALVSDGMGGAIVTWQDGRTGTTDIYAGRALSTGGATRVGSAPQPVAFAMRAPYPNPAAAGRVTVRFDLARPERVTAAVLDLAGHRVRTLSAGRPFPAGPQALTWDGLDDAGVPVAGGVYFLHVRAGGHAGSRRVSVLR